MNEQVQAIHDALSKADLEYSGYSCNGTNLFGDRKSIDAAARAFHSHSQIDHLQTNIRHWRDECGKLHAKQKALELDNLQLRSTLTAIRDRLWTDGETYDERIGDLKWLARESLEQKSP